jgi:hypothetical protein
LNATPAQRVRPVGGRLPQQVRVVLHYGCWGGTSNWHGEDVEGATTKRRGTMTTKTMSQDDTDNDNDNEGTDDNKNNDGDQGIRGRRPMTRRTNHKTTTDEDDNHHKMTTGTETETDNHNHKTKTAAAGARRAWDKNRRRRRRIQCCTMRNAKKGPRDIDDVSWVVGKYFSCSFHVFVTNKVFRY